MKKQEKRRRKIRQRKEDARLNRRITARLLGVDVSQVVRSAEADKHVYKGREMKSKLGATNRVFFYVAVVDNVLQEFVIDSYSEPTLKKILELQSIAHDTGLIGRWLQHWNEHGATIYRSQELAMIHTYLGKVIPEEILSKMELAVTGVLQEIN